MPVINQKERSNAKWRFAGLYLFSLALPALLFFNIRNMNKVECEDTSQLVEQLKKRDQALAELSQLAITLNTMQQLKPAFQKNPDQGNKAKYDQLKYDFENGVNNIKRLYFSDTTLYNTNYKIVESLDYNYSEYNSMPEEFDNKLQEETIKAIAKLKDPNSEVIRLTNELRTAEKKIAKLESIIASIPKSPGGVVSNTQDETPQLREKVIAMEENLKGINVLLAGIEEYANKIQKKSDHNLDAKKQILEKVHSLKEYTKSIKNSNDVLLGMAKLTN